MDDTYIVFVVGHFVLIMREKEKEREGCLGRRGIESM